MLLKKRHLLVSPPTLRTDGEEDCSIVRSFWLFDRSIPVVRVRDDSLRLRPKRVELFFHELAEVSPCLEGRQNRGAGLHKTVNEERTVVLRLQQRRAPEVLLDLLGPHEKDASNAHCRELRQQPLHHARPRRRKNQVDPRSEGALVVGTGDGDFRT